MSRQKSSPRFHFTGSAVLLSALVFLVPALKEGNPGLYLLAVLVPSVLLFSTTLLARVFSLDRMILSLALFLCAMGIAALALSGPDAARDQALRCCAGLAALLTGGVLIRSLSPSILTSVCTAFLGLLLLTGKLLSPDLNLPLTEAAQALLLISFASLLSRQGPVPALLLAFAVTALLLIRDDIADAWLWSLAVLALLFAADGRPAVALSGLAGVLLCGFGSFFLYHTGTVPRNDGILSVMISVGAAGAEPLPAEFASLDTDCLFPLLVGRFGLIFGGLAALLFLPLTLRGASVASFARARFHAVLAMGITLLLALRTLSALLSLFGILPLSGPDVPLLTASLPALCAQLFLLGLLCGISGRNDADLAEDAHLAMLAK